MCKTGQIVIIGYSMAPGNVAINDLLRESIVGRQGNPAPEVEVVLHSWNTIARRCAQYFAVGDIKCRIMGRVVEPFVKREHTILRWCAR